MGGREDLRRAGNAKEVESTFQTKEGSGKSLEARAGIEPAIEVLQTSALPLGYRATTESIDAYRKFCEPTAQWVRCFSPA